MSDDIDVELLIQNVKNKMIADTFTDDMFYDVYLEMCNIDKSSYSGDDAHIMLKALDGMGIVSYIGTCGPPDVPNMFCEFKFNEHR